MKTSKACVAMVVAFAVWTVHAQEHVVPLPELRGTLQTAQAERARNIGDIERVLSYPAAAEALRKANVNQGQVRAAVATLDGDELARLAQQARASESDVKAGFIVGILALIGLVVVIIIVVALVADARPLPSGDAAC